VSASSLPTPLARDRLRAITHPPTSCPACHAEAGKQHPVGYTSRHCARRFAVLKRQLLARRVQMIFRTAST
jgi:hypothetical protein